MKPHGSMLEYVTSGRNVFKLRNKTCAICKENYELIRRKDSKLLLNSFSTHSFDKIKPLNLVVTEPRAIPAEIEPASLDRRAKLEKVLEELKIHELAISAILKHSLVALIDRCLDAFAVDDVDLALTTLVEHAINTGDTTPFKEKLRPLPYARRDLVKMDIDRF